MQYSVVAVIFLGFGTAIFIFFKPSKITNYPSSGTSIVMFGDSLTYGTGATVGKSLPELLSVMIKEHIVNMGVRGQTSAEGLARVDKVLGHDPKVVLVLFGGNDYLQEIPVEETFKNIESMVTTLQEYGAVVVLLGIQGGILFDPYKEEFKKIAKRRGAFYISNILENIIGEEDLMSDEVHPNDKGYALIAKRIYPILKKAL
jgi:lysophospholipase L1-like esterase